MDRRTALIGLLTLPIAHTPAHASGPHNPRVQVAPPNAAPLKFVAVDAAPLKIMAVDAAPLKIVAVDAAPLKIVAAQAHYANLARQLAPDAQITSVPIGPSQDPHTFEPGPAIGRALARAQLVIQNGLDYDAWLDRLLHTTPRRLIIADILGRHPGDNPHLWYDPTGFEPVTRALATALGDNTRLAPTLARFEPIAARIATLRAAHAGTPIAATEPVYTLMTQAIGLDMRHTRFQLAIMNGTEPRVSDIAALEADLRTRQVRILITNSQTAGGITQRIATLARRANIPLAPISETMPATLDYQAWLMASLDTLRSALEAK